MRSKLFIFFLLFLFPLIIIHPGEEKYNESEELRKILENERILYSLAFNNYKFAEIDFNLQKSNVKMDKYFIDIETRANLPFIFKDYVIKYKTVITKDLKSFFCSSVQSNKSTALNYSYFGGNLLKKYIVKKKNKEKVKKISLDTIYPICEEILFVLLLRTLIDKEELDEFNFYYNKKLNKLVIDDKSSSEDKIIIEGHRLDLRVNKEKNHFFGYLTNDQNRIPYYGEVSLFFGIVSIKAEEIYINNKLKEIPDNIN